MIKRKIQDKIIKNLNNEDILLIIGARQVGKTTLLNQIFNFLKKRKKEAYYYTLEDPSILADFNLHPDNIFNYIPKKNKHIFLFIDEIQYLENPTNFLKYIYDLYKDKIKLIVSGSSAFYLDRKFKDSLAGRKKIFELYPFSFSEFLSAKGEQKLYEKVINTNYFKTNKKIKLLKPEFKQLRILWQEYSIFGGYPKVVLEEDYEEKKMFLKELYQSFLKKDIYEAGIDNETKFYMLLKILASQVGQLVNNQNLSNILGISNDTVAKYLYIMQKSYIIKLCAPFYRNIRKELTRMPKVFFLDNGYRNGIISLFESLPDRIDKGQTFENIFFTEIIKLEVEKVNFWRTQDKTEIDFIVNEKYAFELKMNIKSFNINRYKNFLKYYPQMELKPVTYHDEKDLDIFDFIS